MDKSLEKQLILWLRQQKSICGPMLRLSVALACINAVALVAQSWLLASVLSDLVLNGVPVSRHMPELLVLLALLPLRALLAWGRERAGFEAGLRLRRALRGRVLDRLSALGPAYIRSQAVGSWASKLLEQVEQLQDFYGRYLPQMTLVALVPLLILVSVWPLNWAAGLILLGTAPLIPLFMVLVGMGASDANKQHFQALSRLAGHFMDRLRGLSTLRLFDRAAAEQQAIENASEEFRHRTMAVLRLAFLSSAVLEFFAAVSIALLAVYFGFSLLGHLDFGHYGAGVQLGSALFVLLLAPEFYQPLRELGTHYHAKAQAVAAAEALHSLLEGELHTPAPGEQPLPDSLAICAKDLRVMSHDGQCLLGPVSFAIADGEQVVILGPSGAGKSSLLNALLGFLPYEGSLTVGGVELRDLDMAAWRAQLLWLSQEPQLLHCSVRDNVAMGRPLSDAEIWALLEQAHIAELVRGLPQGLEQILAEQGSSVSVGQAQRLALARALAGKGRLLLLDEPGASLDVDSERLVMDSLKQAALGRTRLLISHRLDELNAEDTVLYLAQGQLQQQGKLRELALADGPVARLLAQEDAL
ncbi:heme ABC transporter permease/ATP-binding protein CydD [Shewanella sedimentimangrovi]|uniref:Cysteine/glutathione ABC transporter permease/ATP-binding protein CydD n=1 Tax=Shewanella sedimentimangrovi TaxID=2814293 RepID=A0ABX7R2C4_9GAMM|nr:cysteine/glutathione ABC transporter permease/ATP-binding protein CydD [Shewanella sedimentimangrovi]QSX37967.1 cysteine/glutathione ABC transporter permease/ATP-binding protein CydD [Shewanella sedimentimangrovi]